MKTHLKILFTLLIIIPVTVSADAKTDNLLRKQCQNTVYGTGKYIAGNYLYMNGMIIGMLYTVSSESITSFAKKADTNTIQFKACKNALNDTGRAGFLDDFLWSAYKLISKDYDKM